MAFKWHSGIVTRYNKKLRKIRVGPDKGKTN